MDARGQLWSLDVVLAAVVFTLAIGLIISQSELATYYGQQDRSTRALWIYALLASNGVTSKAEITIPQIYPLCVADINQVGGGPFVSVACPFVQGSPTIVTVAENVRCGPNQEHIVETQPVVVTFLRPWGWSFDNELSWMENCIISRESRPRPQVFGITDDFGLDMNAEIYPSGWLRLVGFPPPIGKQYFSFTRKMIVFADHNWTGAWIYRQCMDGNCGLYLTDMNVTVWRP